MMQSTEQTHRTKSLAAVLVATLAGSLVLVSHVSADAPNRSAQGSEHSALRATPDTAPTENSAGTVNIQTASADELQRLPGIGPAKAAAIVEFRTRTPFRRVEDLMRVRGVGRAIFRNVRAMISITGNTTLASRPLSRRTSAVAAAEQDEDE